MRNINTQNIAGEQYEYFGNDGITYKEFQKLEREREKNMQGKNESLSHVLSDNSHEFYPQIKQKKVKELEQEIHDELSPEEFWRKNGWSKPTPKTIYYKSNHSKLIKQDIKKSTRTISQTTRDPLLDTLNGTTQTIHDSFLEDPWNEKYNENNTFEGMQSKKKISKTEEITLTAGTLNNSFNRPEALIGGDYKKTLFEHDFGNGNSLSFSAGGGFGIIPKKQTQGEYYKSRDIIKMRDRNLIPIEGTEIPYTMENLDSSLPPAYITSQINSSDRDAKRTYHLVENITQTNPNGTTSNIKRRSSALSEAQIRALNEEGIGTIILGTEILDKKDKYMPIPVANISAKAELKTNAGNFFIEGSYLPPVKIGGTQMPEVSNIQAGYEFTFPRQPKEPTDEMLRDD